MALSTDQQATLRLLLERGQTYADLAKLLGEPEADVRERARASLEAMAGADPDRRAPLTDFLLGQSDPIDRADAARHLRSDPEDHELATTLAVRLRELYPEAQLPRLPGEPRRPRAGRRRPRRGPESEPSRLGRLGTGLSPQQARTMVALGAGAILLVVVVLALAGVFGGGDDEGTSPAATDATTTTPDEDGEDLAVIQLRRASGGDAAGEVRIGLATAGQPYADLSVEGLDPPNGDDAYVLWLLLNPRTGYPVSVVDVPANGRLTDRYAIPSPVAAVAARTQCVDISLASRRELQREIVAAAEEQNPVIPFTGESVLRGAVPGTQGC